HEALYAVRHHDEEVLTVLTAAGKPAGPAVPLDGFLIDSCICSDNKTAAAVSVSPEGATGKLVVCDVPTGRQPFPPRALPSAPLSVAARPNHTPIAGLCAAGQLLVFDGLTGKTVLN